MSTENIDKLPKWAQQRIRVLESNLAAREKELEAHGKELEYSQVGVGYRSGMTRRQIPSDYISFVTKKGTRFNVSLTREDRLDINVSARGDTVIYSRSSNAFEVADIPRQ